MPTQTFFNLPQEKRQVILDLALEEFSSNPYALASVSRVVSRAGIAKGSFYQYFADKKDLFLYLLEYATRTQLEFLQEQEPPMEADFFVLLRWQMTAALQVGLAYPRLVQFMYRAFYDQVPFHDEVVTQVRGSAQDTFRILIQQGIEQGILDPSIDIELAAFLVDNMMAGLHRYIWARLNFSPEQFSENILQDFDETIVEPIYDQVIHLLRYGLSKK